MLGPADRALEERYVSAAGEDPDAVQVELVEEEVQQDEAQQEGGHRVEEDRKERCALVNDRARVGRRQHARGDADGQPQYGPAEDKREGDGDPAADEGQHRL